MQAASFQRARQLAGGSRTVVLVWGVVAALFPPVLIVLLGLAVHILVTAGDAAARLPGDPLFGGLLQGDLLKLYQESPRRLLVGLAMVAAVVALLQALAVLLARRAGQAAARRAAAVLKSQIHAQAFKLGCSDVLGAERGWPEELFGDHVETVRLGMAAWWRALPHGIVLASLHVLLAFVVHPWLALLTIVLALLIWRADSWLRDWTGHTARLWRDRAQQADKLMMETLGLAPVATGYAMEELPGESFADLMRQQQTAATRSDSAAAAYSPCLWLIVLWGIVFLVLVFGLSPTASVAGATALITALTSAYFPLRRLLRLQAALPGWSRAARDIFAYLDRTPAVIALKEAKPLPPLRHELRVDSVTLLDRHGQRLFDEISFTVPAGGRLAVLASDNQTPRALIGLLARFYDPLAGRILFDDVDIRWATLDSLRRQTGLLLHDALLFSGTVRENIGCGQAEFDIDLIHDAAKSCRAMDMILGLPDGFETIVGESGLKLDPWPAYQIAMVRALMRNPSLLVIEEPRAALPEREQAAFEEALQLAATGRTLVVLPTRLVSLRAATTILLFHQGRLAGQGTHAELLQSSELYRHLNYIRFHPFPHVR